MHTILSLFFAILLWLVCLSGMVVFSVSKKKKYGRYNSIVTYNIFHFLIFLFMVLAYCSVTRRFSQEIIDWLGLWWCVAFGINYLIDDGFLLPGWLDPKKNESTSSTVRLMKWLYRRIKNMSKDVN